MHFGRKLRLAVTVGLSACALSLGLIAPTVSGASALQHQELLLLQREQPLIRTGSSLRNVPVLFG